MSYHQTIYNMLRQAGMTEAGALGVLGNWECESNCEPFRLQGDFAPSRTLSKEYVRKIDAGEMPEQGFAQPVGFGLAQWTWPQRKLNLMRFWKQYGGSIADVQMQVEFALKELKSGEYICHFKKEDKEERKLYGVSLDLWKLLLDTNSIKIAAKWVCKVYENPAVHNVETRYQAALRIKAELELGEWEDSEVVVPPEEGWEQIPATEYWPPRTLCKGMTGPDVEVYQAVLKARGWLQQNPDGVFGSFLEGIVKKFQKAYSLDVDGIIGPQTGGELLKR